MLYELPENWSDLGDAELRELLTEITGLAAKVEDRRAGLDLLESYAAAAAEVRGAIEANSRLAAAEAALAADEPETLADDSDEAADEATAEDDTDEATSEGDDVADADATEDDDVVEETGDEVVDEEKELVTASGKSKQSARSTLSAMQRNRAAGEKPRQTADQSGSFTSAVSMGDVKAGQPIDLNQLAVMLTNKRNGFGPHHGAPENVPLASIHAQFAEGRMLGSDAKANDIALRGNIAARQRQLNLVASGAEPFAASGGPLAAVAPSYGFFNPGKVQRPLQDFLDTFGDTNRGGAAFTPPPDLSDVDGDGNALGDGVTVGATDGSTAKGVVTVATAPAEEIVLVQPVSKRIRFDNLNYRVYPEQVEYYLQKLDELESKAVEVDILNEIQTQAGTAVATVDAGEGTASYGAFRHVVGLLLGISHWKRKSLNMDTDDVLDWILPDAVIPALKSDMIRDAALGANFMHAPVLELKAEMLRRFNLNIGFNYYDATAGSYPSSEHSGAVATSLNIPDVVRGYVFAPGSLVLVDGGSQDFGITRDSTLNGTNDLELFTERWVNVAHVGTSVNGYDISMSPTGAAPAGVTAVADDVATDQA